MKRIMAVTVALIVLLAGCTLGMRNGPPANDVDRDRLAQVQADPILAGATIGYEAGKRQTSENYLSQRWTLRTRSNIARQWPKEGEVATPEQWATATKLAQTLLDDGWRYTAVTCSPNGTFSILVIKEFDDFTAAMISIFDGWDLIQRVFIPFHTEAANPWSPGTALPTGSTCIEQPQPSATQVGAYPEHNYNYGFGSASW